MSEIEVAPPESESAALLDVAARFLWNLPRGEVPTVSRLFFQLQQAHWYYEDFYVSEDGPCRHLPNYVFIKRMFETCPLLRQYKEKHDEFITEFKEYVGKIPVYGAICLNPALDKVLVIRSWGGKSWSFPKGKVNEGEEERAAAGREVEEEIGYNIRDKINKDDYIAWKSGEQMNKLYIVPGVPDDGSVAFAPKCRKEVSEIAWFSLSSLPLDSSPARDRQMFWSILNVIPRLLEWVRARKVALGWGVGGGGAGGVRKGAKKAVATPKAKPTRQNGSDNTINMTNSANISTPTLPGSSKKGKAALGGDLMAPLEEKKTDARSGAAGKWSVEDMFATNEVLLRKKFTYDGNPHTFGDYAKFGTQALESKAELPPIAVATASKPPAKKSATAKKSTTSATSIATTSSVTKAPLAPAATPVGDGVAVDSSTVAVPDVFRFDMSRIFAAMALHSDC